MTTTMTAQAELSEINISDKIKTLRLYARKEATVTGVVSYVSPAHLSIKNAPLVCSVLDPYEINGRRILEVRVHKNNKHRFEKALKLIREDATLEFTGIIGKNSPSKDVPILYLTDLNLLRGDYKQ
jgi:hypothetical protein